MDLTRLLPIGSQTPMIISMQSGKYSESIRSGGYWTTSKGTFWQLIWERRAPR